MKKLLFILSIFVVSILNLKALERNDICTPADRYIYLNSNSGFYALHSSNHDILPDGKYKIVSNAETPTVALLNRFNDIGNSDFSFEARIACINNDNKTRCHYTTLSGKQKTTYAPRWGIIWDYVDSLNYNFVELYPTNLHASDELDKKPLHINIGKMVGGVVTVLDEVEKSDIIDPRTGYNTLKIARNGSKLTISIGNHRLHTFASLEINNEIMGNFGIFASHGGCIAVKNLSLRIFDSPYLKNNVKISPDSLNAGSQVDGDSYEGYWTYLDRNIKDKNVHLGGTYRVFLKKSGKGYDMYYISGARVKGTEWKPGMLKARLIPTIFTDHFRIEYFDANMNPIKGDLFARFIDGVILELDLAEIESVIRFSKDQ